VGKVSPQVVRGTGKLEEVALLQLAWWQEKADNWPLRIMFLGSQERLPGGIVMEVNNAHLTCASCGVSVMKIEKDMISHAFKVSEITAMTVDHLRKLHKVELDPENNYGG
jgi:hypothetical protein